MTNAIYDFFYDTGFMPHGFCLLWDEKLVLAHVVSDATIALAYFSLPVFLYVLIRRREDLKFNWLVAMFGLFILLCGITHLVNIWTLWIPSYEMQGVMKVITALTSLATAAVAWPLLPKILAIPKLTDVQRANKELAEQAVAHGNALKQSREKTRQLEESEKELARSNEALDSFAYIASHDLKAPLRAIDNLSQWIEDDLKSVLDGETRENMVLLRGRVERMTLMLDDLLTYSRIGRSDDDIQEIMVDDFLKDTFDLTCGDTRFALELDGEAVRIETAVAPLRLVITNLISNAVKHHDGETGVISVSTRLAGDWVDFSVTDDGPGIADEHHERVFEMFQTLAPRDDVEGTGLGLAAVKKTVEAVGGAVRLETGIAGEGRGLTVHFTWPASMKKKEAA